MSYIKDYTILLYMHVIDKRVKGLYLQGNFNSSPNNDVISDSMTSCQVHDKGNEYQNNWCSCNLEEKKRTHTNELVHVNITLTPAKNRNANYELCCDSNENNDKFLEHEQCLSCHPHHSHQCEIVHEDRHCHTTSIERGHTLGTQCNKHK